MTESGAVERAKNRIAAVGRELDIPGTTVATAETLFERVHEEFDFEGRRADPIAAAGLTLACRNASLPVTVTDVTRTWREIAQDPTGELDVGGVTSRIELVSETTGVSAPPTNPTDLTERYAEELGVPPDVATTADGILSSLVETAPETLTGGTSPSGDAAAALYLAARANDARMEFTQAEIGRVADVSEVTIRNRYQAMAEVLGGEEAIARGGDDLSPQRDGEEPRGGTDRVDEIDDGTESGGGEGTEDSSSSPSKSPSGESEGASSDGRSVEIGLETYLALRSTAEGRGVEESTIVAEALEESLKTVLDGGDLVSIAPAETVSVEVELPDRVRMVLDAIVSDPEYGFDSEGTLATAAVAESVGADPATDQVSSVELPEPLPRAANDVIQSDDRYDSLHDLLHDRALGRVMQR